MDLNEICDGEPTVGRNLDITANPAWLLELLGVLGVAADPSHAAPAMPGGATKPQRIAVVGSGIAGLGSAWLLHKAGHEVVVYESEAACADWSTWTSRSLYQPHELHGHISV
jgi:NADPH-dependent 2,4-dienoyl-CoA reductase/sulfur reductase-like enzyme